MTIEYNIYGCNEYTVQYEGDDVWFESLEEAERFTQTVQTIATLTTGRSAFRVKDDCIDSVYGSSDSDVVDDYQTNGIPVDDLRFLLGEWGANFIKCLEESV